MDKDKEIWFIKWKAFFTKLNDVERHKLKGYLHNQLTKDCPTWEGLIDTLDKVQRAAKGDLNKGK